MGVAGLVVLAGVALAAPGYDIAPAEPVEVPERTVELQGNSYTVDTTVRAAPNATISVDVTAPAEVYRVYIYNSDEQIEASRRGEGNGTVTFDLDGFAPGSYVISAYSRDSGEHEAIEPLLVSGYDLDVDAPATVGDEESVTVGIDATPTAAEGEPALVRAVVAGGGRTVTVNATSEGDGYVATVGPDRLAPGEYRVYGLAQAGTRAFGRNELIGLSDRQTLVVEASDTAASTGTAERTTGTSRESAGQPSQSSTATAATAGTPEATRTSGVSSPSPGPPGARTESVVATAARGDTPTPAAGTTRGGDGVITPQFRSGTEAPTASGASGPGFSLAVTLVALLGSLIVAAGRRRR